MNAIVRQTLNYIDEDRVSNFNEYFFIKFLIWMIESVKGTNSSIAPEKRLVDADALDIGACLGFYSVFLSAVFKQVYAFEPDATNFNKLVKSDKLRIRYLKQAIYNYDGLGFVKTNENITNHTTHFPQGNSGDKLEPVEFVTLNTFCKDKFVKFIKCDVEGAEEVIFDRHCAFNELRRTQPIIALEIHEGIDHAKVYQNFLNCGYNQFFCDKGRVDKFDITKAKHYLIGCCEEMLEEYWSWYIVEGKFLDAKEYTLQLQCV